MPRREAWVRTKQGKRYDVRDMIIETELIAMANPFERVNTKNKLFTLRSLPCSMRSGSTKPYWTRLMNSQFYASLINWLVIYFAWQNHAKNKRWLIVDAASGWADIAIQCSSLLALRTIHTLACAHIDHSILASPLSLTLAHNLSSNDFPLPQETDTSHTDCVHATVWRAYAICNFCSDHRLMRSFWQQANGASHWRTVVQIMVEQLDGGPLAGYTVAQQLDIIKSITFACSKHAPLINYTTSKTEFCN